MFDKLDLTKSLGKDRYDEMVPPLKLKLGRLQRMARDENVPIMIIFEGLNTIGLGSLVNDFTLPLDPRGFIYYYIGDPDMAEQERPFMWRFWMRTPLKGTMAIFDRSYYSRSLIDRCGTDDNALEGCAEAFRWFERQLFADDTVVIKLFLHMSNEEQERRMDDPVIEQMMSCGFLERDIEFQEKGGHYLPLFERLIEETDSSIAPWTIVEANDRNFALAKIFSTVTDAMETGIQTVLERRKVRPRRVDASTLITTSIRNKLDLSLELSKDEYELKMKELQAEVKYVQCELHRRKVPMIILFEGWDASGKGGNIKRLTQNMNPRTYHVVPIFAPTPEEGNRHYLTRFMDDLPRKGHITIFDRSWYGRVLVERVEELASELEWRRAYRELNEFEEMLVRDGTIIVKFWLEIDKEEQLKRFNAREDDPDKQWKLTKADWRNREKWNEYSQAVDEILLRTSTTYAPWMIVESNDKRYSRIKVLKTVVDVAKKEMGLN